MLYKNTFAKIKNSLGRYISLMVIVMVGVGFYAGVEVTAPDIIHAADGYFRDCELMDFKIVGTMGLTDGDAAAVSQLDGVRGVVPSRSLDVQSTDGVIRIHAIESAVNTPRLISGVYPGADNECLADSVQYSLGDTVEITGDSVGMLKNSVFTVVGLVDCVLYLSDDYGSTTVGSGKLSSFVFINDENFILDVYTEIYVLAETGDTQAYSGEYDTITKPIADALARIKPERERVQYDELSGFSQFRLDYPKWYIYDRSAVVGYDVLGNSIGVVAVVADVLPLFFILISMLMTSNSMTRMIAEERGELGTFASLGYSRNSIIKTYVIYVLSAAWLGAVAGFFIGCRFIPPLIYSNFTAPLPQLTLRYDVLKLVVILAVASVLMTLVTVSACLRQLRQKPAYLMRPLPPGRGKRIFFERIGLVWRRLSFTWKVTMRNIFRYKKRAIMTIIGVSGCTALLVTAFGLRDGMSGVAEKQYGDIFRYDVMLILKNELSGDELNSLLESESISEPLLMSHSAFKCVDGDTTLECFVIAPRDMSLFERYYRLNTPDNEPVTLDGIVVSQRIAKVYKLHKGDTLTVLNGDNNRFELTVSGIAENYTSNFIYMNPSTYKSVFGEETVYNAVVAGFDGDETALTERLLDSGIVVSTVFTSDAIQSVRESTQRLGGVVVLIIAVASLLAVVVLYNLTAINISERTREIATLKVLGFRDSETNAYIYREAIVLTLISIALGSFLGIALHRYIVQVIEESVLSLTLGINWYSFILSAVLTVLFSAIMQVVTYFKLRKLDMLQSLKSVE